MTEAAVNSPSIRLDSMPLIASDSSIRQEGRDLVIETPDFEFTAHNDTAVLLSQAFALADGNITVAVLASLLGRPEQDVIMALEPLAKSGVVIDLAAPLLANSTMETLDSVLLECRQRMRSLVHQPFWHEVLSGKASRSLILGWGVEFTKFVSSANDYMPLGIAFCRAGPEMREAFSRHYVEEAFHGDIFREGLAGCGLDLKRVDAALPLASTRMLINRLKEFAMLGAVPYASCFAVMQPSQDASSPSQVHGFYQELRDLYPFAAPMFDAFERHALFDIELEHEVTLLETYCQKKNLTAEDKREVMDVIRSLSENFIIFFEGLLDAYRDPYSLVPRPAPTLTLCR